MKVSQYGKCESFFECSRRNHQALWWNLLSWGPPQERKTQSYLMLQRISSLELPVSEIAAQINASQSWSNGHIFNCSEVTAWIRPSWSNCCKEPTTKGHHQLNRRDLLGPRNRINGHSSGGNLSFGLMSPNLRFLLPTAVSLWDAD